MPKARSKRKRDSSPEEAVKHFSEICVLHSENIDQGVFVPFSNITVDPYEKLQLLHTILNND